MDWWRNYAVRYLLGNIVGAVLVNTYINKYDLWPSISSTSSNDFPLSQKLIILGILGFGYCYIASVPILVFHAIRNVLCGFKIEVRSNKKQSIFIGLLFFVVLCLIVFISMWESLSSFKNILFYFILAIEYCALFIMFYKKYDYYDFICQLDKKRKKEKKKKGEFIDSYRHLREHGNAFFIILFEISLFQVVIISSPEMLLLLVLLWVIPGAAVWLLASWIESYFAQSGNPESVKKKWGKVVWLFASRIESYFVQSGNPGSEKKNRKILGRTIRKSKQRD
jgi:hypothetical protein